MPEKILELLESKSLTELQIAEKLTVSVEEVKACMEYLLQMGFIKSTTINPTSGGCSEGCGGNCGKCNASCHVSISASSYTVWEIL